MGRKGSARGPSGKRCLLLGPFCNDASIGAPLHREAFSPPLVHMCAGLVDSHLRFLFAPCVPGVCLAVVAVVVLALATDLASQTNTWEFIPDLYRSLLHAAISTTCLYQRGKTVNDLQREENQNRV